MRRGRKLCSISRYLLASALAIATLGCSPPMSALPDEAIVHIEKVRIRQLGDGRFEVNGEAAAVTGSATDVRVSLVAVEGGLLQVQNTEVTPFGAFLAEVGRPGMPPARDLRVVIWPLANGKTVGRSATVSVP